jgi:predicted HTH transcriptional regulator
LGISKNRVQRADAMNSKPIQLTDKIIINIMALMSVERTEEDLANRLKSFPAHIKANLQFLVKAKYLKSETVHGTAIYSMSDATRCKVELMRFTAVALAECTAMGGMPGRMPMAKDDDVYTVNNSLRLDMLELMANGSEESSGSIAKHTGRKSKAIHDQFLQMDRRGLVNRLEYFVNGHKKIKYTISEAGLAFLAASKAST